MGTTRSRTAGERRQPARRGALCCFPPCPCLHLLTEPAPYRTNPTAAVVYIGKGDPAALEAIQGVGIAAQSFDDLLASGAGEEVTPVPPKPDDVCCIMYTRCVCW